MSRDHEFNPCWQRDYGDPMIIPDVAVGEDATAMRPLSETTSDLVGRLGHHLTVAKLAESPIETIFGGALSFSLNGSHFELAPQFRWSYWRIDFAILHKGHPLLFIECDGAEFHSKPEDVARDRRKDAAALDAGILMLRFTGSEIVRFPEKCVDRTLQALKRVAEATYDPDR